MNNKIKIFTDGSCIGNPGPGGYGIILRCKHLNKEISSGYKLTTNNRMELMATIFALEELQEPSLVYIYTDSKYVSKGITDWIYVWKKYNWNIYKKKVKNIDLWKRLYLAMNSHIIKWIWIKSHTLNWENKRCDKLARKAALYPEYEDIGYIL